MTARCASCVMDGSIPGIRLDSVGVCNYCRLHSMMGKEYPIGNSHFEKMVSDIREQGAGHAYDAVIGISGGCDSSYLLALMAKMGVRLLAVHLDNGWNTRTAMENMHRMVDGCSVTSLTRKIDQHAFDSVCRSFMYAGTPDADTPNDLALLETMSQAALDHDAPYVLNGHSFRTEGSAPLGWTYMDGGYLEDVNSCFEDIDLAGFPHFSWEKQLEFWQAGIRTVRPLYHLDYRKEAAKSWLHMNFGWEWYGGLHAENIYTKFVGRCLWPRKFDIDYRMVEYSALVRSGQMSRDVAIDRLREPVVFEDEYLGMVLSRLGLSYDELEGILREPPRSYTEYRNYLPRFRDPDNQRFFKQLMDEGKIPLTFYKKYVTGV